MKTTKNILTVLLFLFFISAFRSQNGLENIIVEKYYISGPNDTVSSRIHGFLPIGSTTYRIYVDMLPGYRFHAAYGTKEHELKMQTTTVFFNNEDVGNKIPNTIPRRTYKRNTVMLDSWLSAGGAGEEFYGILKEQDDSIGTVVHEKLFLQSNNKLAGISLTKRDGLAEGNNVPYPSFFGIDSAANVFFNASKGSLFSTSNGAWGCLGGAVGLDSLTTNRVLIAQITTNGDFTFELNIQLGRRGDSPENYVAKNPVGKEIMLPCLTYFSREAKLTSTKTKAGSKKTNSNNK